MNILKKIITKKVPYCEVEIFERKEHEGFKKYEDRIRQSIESHYEYQHISHGGNIVSDVRITSNSEFVIVQVFGHDVVTLYDVWQSFKRNLRNRPKIK